MRAINFKYGIVTILAALAIFFAFSSLNLYSQCCKSVHGNHSGHSGHSMQSKQDADTTIIRKGIIDVYDIDSDLDGYVFQDQMHWNVISDKSGKCPLCGMDLEKVKIVEAIKNLKDHNFDVK